MGHIDTLVILRSSAEKVALAREEPKPSTCRSSTSEPDEVTCCEVVYKPWKTSPSLSRTHMVIRY